MKEALKEAQNAFNQGEVPVGAVIVSNNTIIARTHNLTEKLTDVTAHAEMMAITSATEALGGKYLIDCHLYVTLEPCVMCGGALAWSQMGEVTFGASDSSRGAGRLSENIYHPKTKVQGGVMAQECAQLMTDFFKDKR